MKKQHLIFIALILLCNICYSQWSVLDTDPAPKQGAYKYQPFTKKEWDASNFAIPSQLKWFSEARYGMFIHFGLSSYVKKDLSWSIVYSKKLPDLGKSAYPDSVWTKWPNMFKLENFNAKEWVQIAKDAGMKYIVVIAKHHDGFHMWDTKFSNFKITNTPFGRDYLKEIIDACHKAKMPVGIYYSQRDWYHPDYAPIDPSKSVNVPKTMVWHAKDGGNPIPGPTHKKYIEYQYNVVRELCSNYGKIDIFWFDAAWWGGMFTADMWDSENLTRMIRKLQPDIIINNRASIPGDFDTPEQQIGRYQVRPWESALTLNGSWAYSPSPIKSKKVLLRDLFSSAQGNGNVLLSWGAHWDGAFDPVQKERMLEIGQWLKKYGYAYYGTKGGPWMPGKWGGATYKGNKVYLYVYDWLDQKMSLPAIPDNSITGIKFANLQEKASFSAEQDKWYFNAPLKPDSIATIIELTMKSPIVKVMSSANHTIFEGTEYGPLIKEIQITGRDWKDGRYIVDLNKNFNVTGIGAYQFDSKLSISVSTTGAQWYEIGNISSSANEISLSTFISGAEVLGRNVRYIRVSTPDGKPANIKIYAK